AFTDLRLGLAQGGLVFGVALALASRKNRLGPISAALGLVVTTADLATANARHVVTVPQRLFEGLPDALGIVQRAEETKPTPGPYRIPRPPFWEPPGWRTTPSSQRVREFVAWERATLQSKYGVPLGVDYAVSTGAAELADYLSFFEAFLGELDSETARALHL